MLPLSFLPRDSFAEMNRTPCSDLTAGGARQLDQACAHLLHSHRPDSNQRPRDLSSDAVYYSPLLFQLSYGEWMCHGSRVVPHLSTRRTHWGCTLEFGWNLGHSAKRLSGRRFTRTRDLLLTRQTAWPLGRRRKAGIHRKSALTRPSSTARKGGGFCPFFGKKGVSRQ